MQYQTNPQLELAEKYLTATGVSIFLTGKAGTGKTTFLQNVLPRLNKRYVIVAPTGVAAINAGGVTIHSFFQLPPCPYLPDVKELITEYQLPEGKKQMRKSRINIIRTLDVLIIDEISMVRADLLDSIDNTLRRYRRNSRPFGGVQLLMIGDIHQLPPVVTSEEEPYIKKVYSSPFFFESKAFKKLNHITIELTTVYRQQDLQFLTLLNRVRTGSLDAQTLETLNSRYCADVDARFKDSGSMPIRLTTHNKQADSVNRRNLEALNGREYSFDAVVTGNFPEGSFPAERTLRLKEGAQVMFLKNDPTGSARYYNGKLGVVKSLDSENGHIVVRCGNESVEVEPVEWQNVKYDINPADNSITQTIDGTFVQFPLRLAWAVTIHKAQGLTFDSVIVDAADAFAYGQVYVALSRCRSLEGLTLSSRIGANCTYVDSDVDAFNRMQPSEQAVRENYESNACSYYVSMLFEMLSPKQLCDTALRIDHFNRAYLLNIAPVAVEQWNGWMLKLQELDGVCDRFRSQVDRMVAGTTSAADAQNAVAERVAKAVRWFKTQYSDAATAMLPLLDIEIENKERSKTFKEMSETFVSQLELKNACFDKVAASGFTVEAYQKAKCDYMLGDAGEKRSAVSGRQSAVSRQQSAALHDLEYPELLPHLVAWRRSKYEEMNVPAFVVMNQKTLIAVAKALPRSLADLSHVPGIGKTKLKAFGDEIVEVIENFCREKGI